MTFLPLETGGGPMCYFGIGGGSDFFSASLFTRESDVILTALAPLVSDDNAIDLPSTIAKYMTRGFRIESEAFDDRVEPSTGCPILVDSRRRNAYGVIVPDRRFQTEFVECLRSLKQLLGEMDIRAIDTGGDCLRGRVKGMGDTDISFLYESVKDTRDENAIYLIRELTQRPIHITILGPGSDGETSEEGLKIGYQSLRVGESSSVHLVREGNIQDLVPNLTSQVGWCDPKRDSTIGNILRGFEDRYRDRKVPIERRGVQLHEISSQWLTRYWIVRV